MIIWIFIGVYAAAIAIGISVCAHLFPFTGGSDGTKNFGVAATVVVAAISGVMTAAVGLFTLYRNVDTQESLKRLENKLLNERDLVKNTREAYRKLLSAADTAYSLLAKLESNEWVIGSKGTMEAAFLKAIPELIYCRENEHRRVWLIVQQRSTFLAESAADMRSKSEQAALWRDKNAAFSTAVRQFEKFAQDEIQRGTELEPEV